MTTFLGFTTGFFAGVVATVLAIVGGILYMGKKESAISFENKSES